MKRLLAITLLGIHLFNLMGYPFLFRVLILQSGRQFSQQIDNNKYNDKDLVEIKVALNTPYISTWESYERYEGEITLNGVHHNYVKRKVAGDTLYLLCLPNKETNKLYAAKADYGKTVNDLPGTRKNGEETIKKGNLLNQYHEDELVYNLAPPRTTGNINSPSLMLPLPDSHISVHGQPPEINS